jgi:hypothetical protein
MMQRRPIPHSLSPTEAQALDAQGYRLLRGAVAAAELDVLRELFDQSVIPSDAWPVPRGADWRHALLDHHPLVQRICRAPALLASAWHMLKAPFFFAQVEGREPLPQGGAQLLHRDVETAHASAVVALIFLDPFGPDNGATQLVAGSHTLAAAPHGEAVTLAGAAGDILLFDGRLRHGATCNQSGARRRSLLASYVEAAQLEDYRTTANLRGARMPVEELFVGTRNKLEKRCMVAT